MLEQSPKISTFFEVTGRATYYNVRHIICAMFSKWNDMFDVMFSPLNFGFAIIATPFLAFILTLNIFWRVRACGIAFKSASSVIFYPKHFTHTIRFTIFTLICIYRIGIESIRSVCLCADFFMVTLIPALFVKSFLTCIFSSLCQYFFRISLVKFSRFGIFTGFTYAVQPIETHWIFFKEKSSCRFLSTASLACQCFWTLSQSPFINLLHLQILCSITRFANVIQSIGHRIALEKVVGSLRQIFTTDRTTLVPILRFRYTHFSATVTLFATLSQMILVASFCMKKIKCCRVKAFTSEALFQGNIRGIIHDLNRLSLRCLILGCCQGDKAITLSHKLIRLMLDNIHIIA